MKPATVKCTPEYKKLFFEYNETTYYLPDLIGPISAKLSSVLWKIDPKAKVNGSDPLYNRVYRRMKFLRDKGLYELKRGRSGWVEYEKPGFYCVPTGQLFYLFSQVQNSNSAQKSANKPASAQWWDRMYNIPARCSFDRVAGIKTLMNIKDRHLFKRDLTCPKCKKIGTYIPGQKSAKCTCGNYWKPPLNKTLKNELGEVQNHFDTWHEDIQSKELLFDRGPGTNLMRLPVRTRFTDKGRKTHNIKTYDRGWNRANMLYNRGVFVTLTTDPSLHKSLWHANRHLTKAFNGYMSLLVSRKKRYEEKHYDIDRENTGDETKRLKYIAAYEFQENGLIHLHCCFFGIRYLASIDQISEDWQTCKQGRIAHAYGIRKEGDRWHWSKEKPSDAGGKSPEDYLRKYLEKALYLNENFGLYWAVNKRFSTMSRLFGSKECEGCRSIWSGFLKVCPKCGARLTKLPKGFRFLGSLSIDEMPTARIIRVHRWPIRETGPGVPA